MMEAASSSMKSDKGITMTRLTDGQLKGFVRIAASEIKPDIERLLERKQSVKYLTNDCCG
jgi:hypothetical protein